MSERMLFLVCWVGFMAGVRPGNAGAVAKSAGDQPRKAGAGRRDCAAESKALARIARSFGSNAAAINAGATVMPAFGITG